METSNLYEYILRGWDENKIVITSIVKATNLHLKKKKKIRFQVTWGCALLGKDK